MRHLSAIQDTGAQKSLRTKATGRFYTPEPIGRLLAREIVPHLCCTSQTLTAMDPFCGDGRLIAWLIEEAAGQGAGTAGWKVRLWDIDADAVRDARARVTAAARTTGIDIDVEVFAGDSFEKGAASRADADVLITNPPWERLKPDRREDAEILPGAAEQYVEELRAYDRLLAAWYPLSRPVKKFSGWGTNLSRVGIEMSLRLVRPGGVAGIVSPPSFLGDQDSLPLRRHLLAQHRIMTINYFPAEARLFDAVDQPAITFVAINRPPTATAFVNASAFDRHGQLASRAEFALNPEKLAKSGYYLPTGFGIEAADLMRYLEGYPTFVSLETASGHGLWAGREIDETAHKEFLRPNGAFPFVKGRMLERWAIREEPTGFVDPTLRRIPPSSAHARLAWRDVSRPNQKRRVQASLIPPRWVAGNSLSVAHFRDDDLVKLTALLALVNSLVFEFQVRARLSTGHVSLSAVRQVGVPTGLFDGQPVDLAALASRRLSGDTQAELAIEAIVAQLYGLDEGDFGRLVRCFPKITEAELDAILGAWQSTDTKQMALAG